MFHVSLEPPHLEETPNTFEGGGRHDSIKCTTDSWWGGGEKKRGKKKDSFMANWEQKKKKKKSMTNRRGAVWPHKVGGRVAKTNAEKAYTEYRIGLGARGIHQDHFLPRGQKEPTGEGERLRGWPLGVHLH